jgi:hypothetical protein
VWCSSEAGSKCSIERRWISSVHQNWTVPYKWLRVPVSEVLCSRPQSGLGTHSSDCTGCISEMGDFATLFFLVWQHWGRCCYRHFAANFKGF